MTPHGKVPLNTYASGGIADTPQMAIFGEGRQPEAYVPLPDGKRIPVQLKNVDNKKTTQHIVNNYITVRASSDITPTSASQAGRRLANELQYAQRTKRMSFIETQFPSTVQYTSTGGPGYRTSVVELSSGREQRNQEWENARHTLQYR